jgi:hypothetical protein
VVPFIHPALGLGCERFTSYVWADYLKESEETRQI